MLQNLKKIDRVIGIVLATALLQAATLDKPAPKFVLNDSHQQKYSLSDYKGKVVFINFWASWCGPCQMELPELDRLAGAYSGKKVQILAINVDRDRKAAKKTLAKLGLAHSHLQILWDTKSNVVRTYNIKTMPSSFVLDKQVIIRYTHAGFHDEDPAAWRMEIDDLLSK